MPPDLPPGVAIRAARPDDAALVLAYVRELAEFERLSHEVVADEEAVRRHLLDAVRGSGALLAEADGQPAGCAIFYRNLSSFLGRPGIHLEDLWVRPAFRRRGIGRALLVALARETVRLGGGRLEWTVLDWNVDAQDFYRGLGADVLPDWRICRLTGPALARLGAAPGA